jgi:ribosome-binding protein aMBF1 (putative translation factor)
MSALLVAQGRIKRVTRLQMRAARGFLHLSIKELADKSNVSMNSISGFERGKTIPTFNNKAALKKIFEDAGIRGNQMAEQQNLMFDADGF